MSSPPQCLALVWPPDREQVTGGNLYNAGLRAGLGDLGIPVRDVEVGGWAADAASGPPSLYLVDSLCLDALDGFLEHQPSRHLGGHRVVLVAHLLPGLDPGESERARLATEARVMAQVDGALATSPMVGTWLAARGLGGRVVVVPPAATRFTRRRAAPTGEPVVLMVANLGPVKAVAELLGALAGRLAAADRFTLRVIGRRDLDPGYAAACTIAAADPRLGGRVELFGACAPAALEAHYHAAALFVSAARVETFGMALAEARAVGTPIVARDTGNAGMHVDDGTSGVLCASLEAVADTLVALVRDPARRARLSAGALAAPRLPAGDWADVARSLLGQLAAAGLAAVAGRP